MKYIVCILLAIVVLGGGSILLITNWDNENHLANLDNNVADQVAEQKEQIISFFHHEKESIENIKDALWTDHYAICSIENNGFISLMDDTSIWDPEISPKVKELMEKGKDYNMGLISYGKADKDLPEFAIETYFSKTAMVFNVVYTKKDVTSLLNSDWYEQLEGNWYLFTAAMN